MTETAAAPPPQTLAPVVVRAMTTADCQAAADLIAPHARREIMLWRTAADIARHLPDFLVAEVHGAVVGCVALRDYSNGLFEVRSLAVDEALFGKGIGSTLIRGATLAAHARGARRVFALTRRPNLFLNNGYHALDKTAFPEKVWADCQFCFKRDRCDEVAVSVEFPGGA